MMLLIVAIFLFFVFMSVVIIGGTIHVIGINLSKSKARKFIDEFNNTGRLNEVWQAEQVRSSLRGNYYSTKDKELQELYDKLNSILVK